MGYNDENSDQQVTLWEQIQTPLLILGGFVALIWLIEAVDVFILKGALDQYGIQPRTLRGLYGIFLAPFLHGGFGHVMANTMPVLVLGMLIMVTRGVKEFWKATAVIVIIGGLGTWLTGATGSVHIGASGIIFGYFGFLLVITYFERNCRNVVIAGFVLFLYSGLILGVFPNNNGISWQSHLFGFIGGVVAAYLITRGQDRASDTDTAVNDTILKITEEDLY